MTVSVDSVRARLDTVLDRVADAGGDPARIEVVAVTKGFPAEVATAALGAGFGDLGENYAQELQAKADQLPDTVRWHFIGRLQSNKVRLVADVVSCWQSVDRRSLVDEIAKRAPGARVLVQVDAAGEPRKGGAEPGAVADLVAAAGDAGLVVGGLMAVGVHGDDARTARAFRTVSDLADRLELPTRSMGMTGDLEAAVAAGTTMIRVGTALFGPRDRPGAGGTSSDVAPGSGPEDAQGATRTVRD